MIVKFTSHSVRLAASGLLAVAMGLCSGQAVGPDAKRKILLQTPAVYPEMARQMHLVGEVRLMLTVLASGEVEKVSVLSGHPLFLDAATHAVRTWRFAATPESTRVEVHVNFARP